MSKRAPHRRADAPRRGRPTRSMPRPRTSSRHSARSGLGSAWAPEPVSFLHCRQRGRLAHRAVPRRLDRCAQVIRDAVTNFEVYLEKASRRSSSMRQISMAIRAVASFLSGPQESTGPDRGSWNQSWTPLHDTVATADTGDPAKSQGRAAERPQWTRAPGLRRRERRFESCRGQHL